VDPATKSVQVSAGLLGLFGATLEVSDETKINVEGKNGSLTDIREGAKVKASYEAFSDRFCRPPKLLPPSVDSATTASRFPPTVLSSQPTTMRPSGASAGHG
jgi:hypothetical protein